MAVSVCNFPLYLLGILQREARKYKINFQQNYKSSMSNLPTPKYVQELPKQTKLCKSLSGERSNSEGGELAN